MSKQLNDFELIKTLKARNYNMKFNEYKYSEYKQLYNLIQWLMGLSSKEVSWESFEKDEYVNHCIEIYHMNKEFC